MKDNKKTSVKSYKKWILASIIIATILLIVRVAYDLKWFDVATGILKLESDRDAKVKRFTLKTLSFVTREGDEEHFIKEVESLGWKYYCKYGRGMIFQKDGYEILMTKRSYFGRYCFYEVATREVFDLI